MKNNSLFAKNICAVYQNEGKIWLNSLEEIVQEMEQIWSLENLSPLEDLSYHYVLRGTQGPQKTPIILKLGLDSKSLQNEIKALSFYQGKGCVTLLNSFPEKGALLLEDIRPGFSLKTCFPEEEKKSIQIAVSVIQELHSQNTKVLPSGPKIENWLQALDKNYPLPEDILQKARIFKNELLATTSNYVFLHGDLHHENILYSETRGWLAIDPKGIMGEAIFEVGAFLRNPFLELSKLSNAVEIMQKRLQLFAEYLPGDPERIWKWGIVQSCLAACWSIEDQMSPEAWLEIFYLLLQL